MSSKTSFQVFSTLKVDDVSKFLPPGFKAAESSAEPPKVKDDEAPSTEKSDKDSSKDFKLDISKLFNNIDSKEVSGLLPAGYEVKAKEGDASKESTTEKASLKFPTRPSGSSSAKKAVVKSKPSRNRPQAPPPVVPKIMSFAER